MVTLFILLLLLLGGVFMYLKLQKKTDEEDEVTDTGDDEDQPVADSQEKVKAADSAKKKEKAAEKALAAAKKSGDDSAIKAAAAKAKKTKEDAARAKAAAAAAKAKKAKEDAAAAKAKKAKDDAARAKAAAFEKKKREHAARLRREAEDAKRREEEDKRAVEEQKRKRQRALDWFGSGLGGSTSGFPVQGHMTHGNTWDAWGNPAKVNAKLADNTKVGKMTMKQCHDLGKDLVKKNYPISAVGYRTSNHPSEKHKNTCFFYTNWDHDGEKRIFPAKGARLTGSGDKAHAIACMNPGEILNNGCKTLAYTSKKWRAKMEAKRKKRAAEAKERRRLNEKPPRVQWRWGFPRHGWVNDKLNQSYAKIKNQSAKQCRDHAATINKSAPGFVRLWGHYGSNYPDKNRRNTCFFYTANKSFMQHNDPKPPHFHGRAPWNGDRRHSSGCVEPGKYVLEGCKDRSKINKERAVYRSKTVMPGNISRQTGWRHGGTNLNMKPHQLKALGAEECRQRAIQLNKTAGGAIKAWGFRTSRGHHPTWKNTCFFYTGKGPHGHRGGTNDHLTGCLRPGDNVNWGCTRTRPVDCQQRWTGWSACTKPCGGGTQRRDYKITRNQRGIGKACKIASGAYAPKIRACNTQICVPSARYIFLDRQNGPGTIINLNRVMVVSNGQDVARGKRVVMSSQHSHFSGRHLTDGNDNSMAHTWWGRSTKSGRHKNSPRGGAPGASWDHDRQWIYIDLGREYPIDYVWIRNRKDCCKDRLKNMRIYLGWGRHKPGSHYQPRYFKTSDRLGDVAWDMVLWQPSIGGTLSPQRVPGSYWSKYGGSDD